MGNCRPKKEIIQKTISHWYIPTGQAQYVSSEKAPFDYKVWHEVGGQNDNLRLIGNGSKLEKLYRTRLYSPRGETTDGDVDYNWEYVYQQKYDVKIMDKNDLKDKELAPLEDPENEYTIPGYDGEGAFEDGDPIYYNKPIFKRQCKANTVYDEQYFYHVFYWPTTSISVSRAVNGIIKTTTTTTSSGAGGGGGASTTVITDTYAAAPGTVSGTVSIQGVASSVENPPEGLIYYHGGSFDDKIFFTYEPDANSDGTLKVIAEGDTVNGWTISKVVNYVTDKALRRRVSKYSKRNKTPSYVFVNDLVDPKGKVSSVSGLPTSYAGSIDDYYIVDDDEDTLNQLYYQWNGTAWTGPVNVTGILVGDKVKGKGISSGTTVTQIKGRKIFLSNSIRSRKIRKVTFVNNVVNKVNASTVCYAEISGGSSNFTRDGSYTTTNGCKIKVVAGKGIQTRSAIVGVYAARNKRYLEYSPIFYTRDNDCEKIYIEDSNAKYLIGDVILEDETLYLNDVELVAEPKTDIAYRINNIYWNNFNMPVSKTELENILKKYPDDNKFLELEQYVIDTIKGSLNSKKVSRVLDSTCNDPIYPSVEKIYYPYEELNQLQDSFSSLVNNTADPCLDIKSKAAFTTEELQQYINTNLSKVISSSSMILPEEMYKLVVSNENSMLNRLTSAVSTIEQSVSKIQQIPNLPPMLEGENEAPINLTIETIRRMPPKFGNIEFLVNDVIFDSDNSLNPNAVENNPFLTIRSIPVFTGTFSCNNPDMTLNTVTKTVGTITNAVDYVELTNAPPQPPPPPLPIAGSTSTSTRVWVEPGPEGTLGANEDDNKQFSKHKTCTGARPYPNIIWKSELSYQTKFTKIANFRVNEISNAVSEALANKGNPYQDDPVYAELSEDITSSSTSIKIKGSTANFMNSGYLLLPKFVTKQSESDLKNSSKHYYYLGEEIIYYGSKTANSFENCIRAQFGTNSTFEVIVPAGDIESGFLYTIQTIGNTNWLELGAPEGYTVGTTFKSTKDGIDSTGTAYVFGSTLKPFDNAPPVNTVFHSYQKRNYIVQFWPYKLRTDSSSI